MISKEVIFSITYIIDALITLVTAHVLIARSKGEGDDDYYGVVCVFIAIFWGPILIVVVAVYVGYFFLYWLPRQAAIKINGQIDRHRLRPVEIAPVLEPTPAESEPRECPDWR